MEILITAVDETSAGLSSITENLDSMAEAAQGAADAAGTALGGISESAASVGSGISESLSGAFTGVAEQASSASDAFAASFSSMLGVANASAEDIISAFSGAMSTVESNAASMATDMEGTLKEISGAFMMGGIQIGLAGAAMVAPVAASVKDAADQTEALGQMNNLIANTYSSAGSAATGMSSAVADLTAKYNSQKASIAVAETALAKAGGTSGEASSKIAKLQATLETASAAAAATKGKLDALTSATGLAGGSAADTESKLTAAARAGTDLGDKVADSATALGYFFSQTNSVNDTLEAYSAAQNVAAAAHIPLADATKAVTMGMQGSGKALVQLGIPIKDGLTGATALAAIMQKTGDAAQKAADEGMGPAEVAQAKLNEVMSDAGGGPLSAINQLLASIAKILTIIDNWTEKHQKLATGIEIVVGVLGTLLTVLGSILVTVGLVVGAVALFTGAFAAVAVGTAIVTGAFLAIIAVIGLVILYHQQIWDFIKRMWADVGPYVRGALEGIAETLMIPIQPILLLIKYHQQIWDFIKAMWNDVASTVSKVWQSIEGTLNTAMTAAKSVINTGLTDIQGVWTSIWTGISGFVTNIWNGIKSVIKGGINDIIQAINAFIAGLDSLHISIPTIKIAGVTFGGQSIGFSIPQIPMLASGGIVTAPTLAMIGEAGPEMVIPLSAISNGQVPGAGGSSSGGGNIIINMTGTFNTDAQSARSMANQIATAIQAQLRLKRVA